MTSKSDTRFCLKKLPALRFESPVCTNLLLAITTRRPLSKTFYDAHILTPAARPLCHSTFIKTRTRPRVKVDCSKAGGNVSLGI
jgi:hypothetical protein